MWLGGFNNRSGNTVSMRTRPGGQPEARSSAPASGVQAVFLVGFMGAGKSSVGRALSRRLGWRFEDLDERIQARERRTIEQIFQQSGEAEFRRAEHAAFRELLADLSSSPGVVALGGGAFVHANNAALIEEAGGLAIFLDAPVEELFRRCQQEQMERPLRRDLDQFRQLYETRRPHYMAATLRIETAGKDIETVAAEVVCSLRLRLED
jgi:shikimate kinase